MWWTALALAGTLRPPIGIAEEQVHLIEQWVDVGCWKPGETVRYTLEGATPPLPAFEITVMPPVAEGHVLRFSPADASATNPPTQLLLDWNRRLSVRGEVTALETAKWVEIAWSLVRFSCTRIPVGIDARNSKHQVQVFTAEGSELAPGWNNLELLGLAEKKPVARLSMGADEKGRMDLVLEVDLDAKTGWPAKATNASSWTVEGKPDQQKLVFTRQ